MPVQERCFRYRRKEKKKQKAKMLHVVSSSKDQSKGHKDENSHTAKTGKRKKNTTKTNLKTWKPRWWIIGQRDADWARRFKYLLEEGGGRGFGGARKGC
jgi:hypothetical protein